MAKNLDRIQFNTDVERNSIDYSEWPYNKIIADTKASWIYADPNSYSIVPIPIVDVVRGDNIFIGNREDDDIFNIVYRHWNYILENIFHIHFKYIFIEYCVINDLYEEFESKSDEEKEYIGWKILYPYMQINKIELFEDPSYSNEAHSLMITASFEYYGFNKSGCNILLYTMLDIYYPVDSFGMSEEAMFSFKDIGRRMIRRDNLEQYDYRNTDLYSYKHN